jgi:hypothetical protein
MREYIDNQNERVVLKEYGRNIQRIVNHILTLKDKEERTRYAHTCVELMKLINPSVRENMDYSRKLWDDLYIMSDFKIDVDCPFPAPDKNIINKKPEKVDYSSNRIRYKHYGKNVELLIEKALEIEDEKEKESALIYIARLMKKFYLTWNKETVEDEVIIDQMKTISKNKASLDIEKIKAAGLLEMSKENSSSSPSQRTTSGNYGGGGNGNNRKFKSRDKRKKY